MNMAWRCAERRKTEEWEEFGCGAPPPTPPLPLPPGGRLTESDWIPPRFQSLAGGGRIQWRVGGWEPEEEIPRSTNQTETMKTMNKSNINKLSKRPLLRNGGNVSLLFYFDWIIEVVIWFDWALPRSIPRRTRHLMVNKVAIDRIWTAPPLSPLMEKKTSQYSMRRILMNTGPSHALERPHSQRRLAPASSQHSTTAPARPLMWRFPAEEATGHQLSD